MKKKIKPISYVAKKYPPQGLKMSDVLAASYRAEIEVAKKARIRGTLK